MVPLNLGCHKIIQNQKEPTILRVTLILTHVIPLDCKGSQYSVVRLGESLLSRVVGGFKQGIILRPLNLQTKTYTLHSTAVLRACVRKNCFSSEATCCCLSGSRAGNPCNIPRLTSQESIEKYLQCEFSPCSSSP